MTQLLEQDIQTKEVLDWKGVHLFHYSASSCSQKLRIFLNLKGIDWEPHVINLPEREQLSPWYMGINPRGLVPCLVIDGEVHIESNDIIELLDERFPEKKLIPARFEDKINELLHHEDDMHLDLRSISFRFTQKRSKTPKSAEDLQNFRDRGTGTVQGKTDPKKAREIAYWEAYTKNEGITDEGIRASAERFRTTLDELAHNKGENRYLLGDELTVLDIAWYVYVYRIVLCGYPLDRLHPNLSEWFADLQQRPEFTKEVQSPDHILEKIAENHAEQKAAGTSFIEVSEL